MTIDGKNTFRERWVAPIHWVAPSLARWPHGRRRPATASTHREDGGWHRDSWLARIAWLLGKSHAENGGWHRFLGRTDFSDFRFAPISDFLGTDFFLVGGTDFLGHRFLGLEPRKEP